MRRAAKWLAVALLAGCGFDEGGVGFFRLEPEHCRLPLVRALPGGDPDLNEWWLPGPLTVASTVDWPDCPPVDASTADGDAPRIVYPGDRSGVAEGSWPVIVFGHANSVSVCNPTDRYRSLQEQWASWGWIVYSVDASEENCKPWTVAAMNTRVDKFDLAVEDLRRRNADPRSPFHGRIRFDDIVAVGHSRGGAAAVALASRDQKWTGAISLQGGSPPRFRLGDTYTTVPVMGISGELDKDLDFPHVDLTEVLLDGRYSWHTLRRGNHSFTADGLPIRNSDDPREILPRVSQIELTKFLTVAFLASNFGIWDGEQFERRPDAAELIYSHLGDEFARAFLRGSGFVSRWNLGPEHDAIWVDRFDSKAVFGTARAAAEEPAARETRLDPSVNELGGQTRCDGLATCEEVWTYSTDEDPPPTGYRLASSLLLRASEGGGAFSTVVDRDVPSGWHLQARIRAQTGEPADFAVVIVGDDGDRRIEGVDTINTAGLSDRYVQVDIELTERHVDAVRIELSSGAMHVDDLRFVED